MLNDLTRKVKRHLLTGSVMRDRVMRFPPFDRVLHEQLVQSDDYTRLSAFACALHRLDQEQVAGSIAELGVFRGDTSIVLQQSAPHRHLHLFDTFEGFPRAQLDLPGDDRRFDQTSAAMVRSKLPADAHVTLHVGTVPDSLDAVNEDAFAFVLMDLDLSTPTRAALEFFWPRMAAGAFLFVHDYNSPESGWAMRKVLGEFLSDKPERLIDLPDPWGSVVLRRQG